MKKYIFLLSFLLVATFAVAQQKALYSQYMSNPYLLNPAVSGFEKNLNIKAGFRNQWVGFEGAPKSFYLSGETAILQDKRRGIKKNQSYHGAGGYAYTDNTGPTTRTGMLLSYAYHIPLNRKMYLSSGIFAGFQQFKFDPNKVQLADGSNDRDPVTNAGGVNAFMPDISVGAMLQAEEFYLGMSLFQALGNKVLTAEDTEPHNRLARHLFLSGGYNLDLNQKITLVPSVLLKYASPAPLQADINLKGIYSLSKRRKTKYDDQVWAGVSYRTQDAVVGMIGFQLMEQYQMSYFYDLTVSPLRKHSAGSHEIMLGFRLKK